MNPYKNKQLLNIAKAKAKKLDVDVKPSNKKNKKLDVIKNNKIIFSIGDSRYTDFNISEDKKQRKLYKKRHEKYRNKKNTASYYADKILW